MWFCIAILILFAAQGEGVFAGVVAVFEKAMAEDEVRPLREALLAGGGLEASGAFLGSGATHVVSPSTSLMSVFSQCRRCGVFQVGLNWPVLIGMAKSYDMKKERPVGFFPPCSFLLGDFYCLSCKKIYFTNRLHMYVCPNNEMM
jgi:hypothetical protein